MRRRGLPHFAKLISTLTISVLAATLGLGSQMVWPQVNAGALSAGAAESGPKWAELTTIQRNSLKPLERDWSTIDPDRKQKWIEIAQRIPGMPSAERERIQARMTEWARLSPSERGQARIGFQQATRVSPKDRQAQWEAYQALPAEQRRQLQARAAPQVAAAASKPNGQRAEKVQRKSNIVPNPSDAAPPKSVGPTVVQAQPGATTTLISKRPTPPAHQQTGMPKIAATPEFVDKTTLLPQRGPQAAATRSSAAASTATPRP